FFFFFQAEDGIRDFHVTGVQTCALPICLRPTLPANGPRGRRSSSSTRKGSFGSNANSRASGSNCSAGRQRFVAESPSAGSCCRRSEERRVGKEGRSRWAR